MKRLEKIHHLVKESASHYAFGATIEVTNGGFSEKKLAQARNAKYFFDSLMDRKVKFASGVGYFFGKAGISINSYNVNVMLKVSKYDEAVLYRVLEKALNSGKLTRNHGRFLERVLAESHKLPSVGCFLSAEQDKMDLASQVMDIPYENYAKYMCQIRGIAMELYVFHLFEHEIFDKIMMHRVNFVREGVLSDSDVLIFCPRKNFFGAVDRLGNYPNIESLIITRRR